MPECEFTIFIKLTSILLGLVKSQLFFYMWYKNLALLQTVPKITTTPNTT
jgi:hypothetical protein